MGLYTQPFPNRAKEKLIKHYKYYVAGDARVWYKIASWVPQRDSKERYVEARRFVATPGFDRCGSPPFHEMVASGKIFLAECIIMREVRHSVPVSCRPPNLRRDALMYDNQSYAYAKEAVLKAKELEKHRREEKDRGRRAAGEVYAREKAEKKQLMNATQEREVGNKHTLSINLVLRYAACSLLIHSFSPHKIGRSGTVCTTNCQFGRQLICRFRLCVMSENPWLPAA